MHRVIATACAVLLVAGAACRPATQRDVQELREQISALSKQVGDLDEKLSGAARAAARPTRPAEDFDKVYDIPVAGAPILGDAEAPLTLVEYSDFQCPFCARADPLIKQIASKYPQQVKVIFKHFPLDFHPAARPTAIASMAAQEQGKFWQFHDELFENNADLQSDDESLEKYAREAGLDVERFKRDLQTKAEEYEQRVNNDLREGSAVDVRGTPTLYLNGKKLDPRNRSIEAMSALIDKLLASRQG